MPRNHKSKTILELKFRLFEELCVVGSEQLNDYELEIRELLRKEPEMKQQIEQIVKRAVRVVKV